MVIGFRIHETDYAYVVTQLKSVFNFEYATILNTLESIPKHKESTSNR